MKLRHTIPLALIGFSLIVPPIQHGNQDRVDMMAPFAQWIVEQQFDTEEACYQRRDERMTQGLANLAKDPESPVDKQRMNAVCINSDDPRLKAK